MHSKKIIGVFAVTAIAAAVITACGGGGGSAGTAHEGYKVTLTATPDALPTNYAHVPYVGGTVNNPYYSIIRVEVREGDNLAPTTTLNCGVDDPLVGAMFALDDQGDPITDENGNVTGHTGAEVFRNRPEDASAGVATFGLLAGDKAGDVRVTCSAQDPRSGMEVSGSTIVHVGYNTGLPAQINFVTSAAVGDGLSVGDGQPVPRGGVLAMQIRMVDAALQPVPDPANENLFIELLQTGSPAEQGARLGPVPWGSTVHASTMNGVAQYWLTAGDNEGSLCMRVTADRYDNDVENANGATDEHGNPVIIADPLLATYCVEVSNRGVLGLTSPDGSYINCVDGGMLTVPGSGGAAPYTFELVDAGGLQGVTIDANTGVLTVPPQGATCTDSDRTVRVRLTDATGAVATTAVTFTTGSRESAIGVRTVGGSAGNTFNHSIGGVMTVEGYGGTGPYTYTIANANVGGLTVDENTGRIEIPAGTCTPIYAPRESKDADGNTTTEQVLTGWRADGSVGPCSSTNPHRLYIRATDSAGNTGGEWVTFTVTNDCCSSSGNSRVCGSSGGSSGGGEFSPGKN